MRIQRGVSLELQLQYDDDLTYWFLDEVFIYVYQSRDNSSLIDVIKLKKRKMKMSMERTDMYLMTELEIS
jgi:hypothetical protein